MRSVVVAACIAGCTKAPPAVTLSPAHVVSAPVGTVARHELPVPKDFFDDPPEGPFASLDEYCRMVLARRGNDAPRFCDANPTFARQTRVPGARIVSHDAGGDFVFCSLALELPRGWYVLRGLECENTMNEDDYDFHVGELSRAANGDVVVKMTVTTTGETRTYESRCGVGAASVPRCVTLATESEGRSTGVHFEGDVLVLGKETIDEGGGELRGPSGLLPETPPGRYRIVFP